MRTFHSFGWICVARSSDGLDTSHTQPACQDARIGVWGRRAPIFCVWAGAQDELWTKTRL